MTNQPKCPTCGGEQDSRLFVNPIAGIVSSYPIPMSKHCDDAFHDCVLTPTDGHGTVDASGRFQKQDDAAERWYEWNYAHLDRTSRYEHAIQGYRAAQAEAAARIAELEAKLRKLTDTLYRHGFVPCDMIECNCNDWHARYGLYERMQKLKEILYEAEHPLSNENGNLICNALKGLIAERDLLRARLEWLEEINRRDYEDAAQDDTEIRNIARPIIDKFADGDDYSVTSLVDVVQKMRDTLEAEADSLCAELVALRKS